MPLKFYNNETAPNVRSANRAPEIAVYRKNGSFRINTSMCTLLGLKPGDQLEFAQDEESSKNWYLTKTKQNGYELRQKKSAGSCLIFNSSLVANALIQSAGCKESETVKIHIGEKPMKLQGLLLYALKVSIAKIR